MGTDISGAIECRRVFRYPPQYASGKGWEFAMNLRQLFDTRDYDSFSCLFGVMNFAGPSRLVRPFTKGAQGRAAWRPRIWAGQPPAIS